MTLEEELQEVRLENERLKNAIEDGLKPFAEMDCGDNSCTFVSKESRKGGQHTNGGCRCHDKGSFGFATRRLVHRLRMVMEEVK